MRLLRSAPSLSTAASRARGCALAALVVAAAILSACTSNRGAGPSAKGASRAAATELDPSLTVASIDGIPLTAAELDKHVSEALRRAEKEHSERVHGIRREGLEQLVAERLMNLEAGARGITPEELFMQEVVAKVPVPDEAQVRELYETMIRPRYPVAFEDVADRIAAQLQQEARATRGRTFIESLSEKYKVALSLPAPPVERVEVAATGPSKGPAKAPVTIVAFSDFECPFCSRANAPLEQVVKAYGDKVRVVFRQFPLSFHAKAQKAAEASLCAHDQGKFWDMHDRLFAEQDKLEVDQLKEHARGLGLDGALFDGCLDRGDKAAVVQADLSDGQRAGVEGTPAFFINGRLVSGAQPFEEFAKVIDAELAN